MRRLPIFFVLDVSESMIGEPIAEVSAGLRAMVQTLRQDPYALETAYISVIVFAGQAKTLVPLTDVVSFYPPQLPIGGGTSLGAALRHLMREMETKLNKNDGLTKGDWKPVIFLLTDGVPTDEPAAAIREWEAKYRQRSNLVAISLGPNADLNLLRRLTDQVLLFDDTKPESYRNFFKWVTASITTQSQRVETEANDTLQLSRFEAGVTYQPDLSKPLPTRVDDNCVVLQARCQRNSAPYLIKFKRNIGFDEWPEIIGADTGASGSSRAFSLAGAFALPSFEDYRELSLETAVRHTVNTSELAGCPSCPCCGNTFGFSTCGCGGIHCTTGPGVNVCPWCRQEATYGFSGSDDNTDIVRGLG